MKVKKTVLQAMMVGLALGTFTSCADHLADVSPKLPHEMINDLCEDNNDTKHAESSNPWDDCPGCGMG